MYGTRIRVSVTECHTYSDMCFGLEDPFSSLSSRTCLQQNKLGFATGYFEKAVTAVTSAEGDMAPELISLYQEIAQMEQLKENHEQAIGYLLKVRKLKILFRAAGLITKLESLLGVCCRHTSFIRFTLAMICRRILMDCMPLHELCSQ